MIQIYHAPLTRSLRVIWLCEELSLPYEVVPVDFSPRYRATPEWRAMNPVGKVPVLIDAGQKIFESGAMLEMLQDRYAPDALRPQPGSQPHAEYLQWCWFAEATFARPVGEMVNHHREFDPPIDAVLAEMRARVQVCVDALNEHLAERDFLLGDAFTAADIMTGYTLMLSERFAGANFGEHVARYWQALKSRPAYQRAIEAPAG